MTEVPALEATELRRGFAGHPAVSGLDLDVRRGEVHAVVGLNGAGKTTVFRLLLGMLRPDSGQARVLGTDALQATADVWRRVGHLVAAPLAYPELTVRENLVAAARLHGVAAGAIDAAVEAGVDRCALGRWVDRRATHLSTGNLQRLGLAAVLLHAPRVLVLDEPASGLDPAGVMLVRDLLAELRDDGAAVLLSGHHLDQLARVADRITVLHRGEPVGDLDPAGVDLEQSFFDLVHRAERTMRGGDVMARALAVEAVKLRRSRVVLVASALQMLLVPLLAFALVRVTASGGVGVLAGKGEALVAGTGWDAYLGALGQVAAAGLFVGTGVVVSWVFGREHAEGTFGALFARAVPRRDVALAKVLVTTAWILVVAAGVLGVAVLVGVLGAVGEGRTVPPPTGLARTGTVVLLTTLLTLPIGLVASVGRGYLPAVGAVIGIVAAAQISVFLGAGGWFPFAVPGLLALATEEVVAPPSPAQLALVVLTPLVGSWATVRWWARAEVV